MAARRSNSQYGNLGHKKKKNGPIFWRTFRLRRVEGVFMEHGSGQKYCVKWSNLSYEHISEYGGNHRLFQYSAKERPPKSPKMHGPQPISLDAEGSVLPVSNMAYPSELYASSAQDSEPEYVDPQVPAISPLQICDNDWRTDPTLHLQPSGLGLMLAIHKPKVRFPQHFPAGIEPSDLLCVQFFKQDDLISLLL
jgi:hypothetical protein